MDPITIASTLLNIAGPSVAGLVKKLSRSDKAADIAAKVVSIAQSVTGASTPAQAVDALTQHPELLTAYTQAMRQFDVQIELAEFADIANARARDIEIQKHKPNRRADLLAVLAVLTLWMLGGALLWATIDQEKARLLDFFVGMVSGMVLSVYNFEFGSSRGSEMKTKAMMK